MFHLSLFLEFDLESEHWRGGSFEWGLIEGRLLNRENLNYSIIDKAYGQIIFRLLLCIPN